MDQQTENNTSLCSNFVSLSVAVGKYKLWKAIRCSDGVKKKFQVVLAESVGQDIAVLQAAQEPSTSTSDIKLMTERNLQKQILYYYDAKTGHKKAGMQTNSIGWK